jgi:hypothetical protein
MPQYDDQDEYKNPSISLLIRNSFKNYEATINRYEKLLVDTTVLATSIKEKLVQIPGENEIRRIIEEFSKDSDMRVQRQQDKLDLAEKENTETTNDILNSVKTNLNNLILNFKIIMGWLAIVSVVGATAIAYINFMDSKQVKQYERSSQSEKIRNTNDNTFFEYITKTGEKIKIPMKSGQIVVE